jgi:hypothetical protein
MLRGSELIQGLSVWEIGWWLKTVADFGLSRFRALQALIFFAHEESRSGLVHGLFVEHVWRSDGNLSIFHGGKRSKSRQDYALFIRPGFYLQGLVAAGQVSGSLGRAITTAC